jgi:hypothetical protein
MSYANGDIYVGDWKLNKKDGFGIILSKTKEIFEGEWKNDMK